MTEFSSAFLRSVKLGPSSEDESRSFPFTIPAIRSLTELHFHSKITYFVGENGSGKSTLLEGIAIATGFNPEGGSLNLKFTTRDSHSKLHERLKLVRGIRKPQDGFFLRAESLFNVATAIDEVGAAHSYGGKSLHEQSHGESFLSLVQHRFKGGGLYLLDEPEAALSPSRQMTFLSEIHRLVKTGSQLVIATHSPILMAYPDSLIYRFNEEGIFETTYDETEHVSVTRAFLNQKDKMLKALFSDEE